jgi:hypothetical protein
MQGASSGEYRAYSPLGATQQPGRKTSKMGYFFSATLTIRGRKSSPKKAVKNVVIVYSGDGLNTSLKRRSSLLSLSVFNSFHTRQFPHRLSDAFNLISLKKD